MIVVDEVDDVRPDVQDGHADPAELALPDRAQRVTAERGPPDLDVVDEQADQRVEVATVERDRVPGDQLADLFVRAGLG